MNQPLSRLPDIATLRQRCQAMAMLDAVLSPEWEDRYYSFNAAWGDAEELASMRNGSGDNWFIVFSAAGVYGQCFDHEAPNAPEVLDAVPAVFGPYVTEPAFADHTGSQAVTACFWRENDAAWGAAAADRGGDDLLELLLDGTPEAYKIWAEDYYEVDVNLAAAQHVYAMQPLTTEIVADLNPDVEISDLEDDIAEINYPR
ncbi:hypothetical protein ACFWUP_28165 [Nocardia sp. NPDC058658]|uniref:hypothetical protein n=1 Tax=Nocardia sp. NPDC058658 TaxID=3346580 RepID=UPI0036462655